MAGNAAETAIWQNADVYINSTEGAAGPTDTTTAWGAGWDVVGLLDGEEGFTEGREEDSSEHYAWGGLLYRRTRSKHKRTWRFVALEDNATVFGLVNPGSERSTTAGVRTSVVKVPTSRRFAIGLETREGDRVKRRIAGHAEVSEVGEIKDSETEPTVFEVTVTLFPDADGEIYTTVEDDPAV